MLEECYAVRTIPIEIGHKDQSTLFGTYAAEVRIERLREAVEQLDFGFESQGEKE